MNVPVPARSSALRDVFGALLPLSVRELQHEIEAQLSRVPNPVNEYGFDPYGFSIESAMQMTLPVALLYRHYFRVETFDIGRVPEGRVLLIANHAGQLPFDGAMLGVAMLLEAEPPRICRSMGQYFLPRLRFGSVGMASMGAMVGTPENCIHMLENEECVVAFPEGVRGMNKTWRQRYRLQRMGLGFMRLALQTRTPIVPVAIVGSADQQPGIANLAGVGRMLGLPALPSTLGVPWLGPLGMWPLPVKYRIYFGEPESFDADPNDDDHVIQRHVDHVRREIEAMLARGLQERKGIFS